MNLEETGGVALYFGHFNQVGQREESARESIFFLCNRWTVK